MADISTAVSRARVPILGENGRISNDYIPESIPQSVEAAEQAARDAAGSASKADGSAKAAEDSASAASGYEQAAKGSADAAGRSAEAASKSAEASDGSAKAAEGSASAAAGSAEKAKGSATSAQTSATAASGSASQAATSADEAASSATKAAQSAEQVADKYITGATATTLEPGKQATAQVVKQVLQLGIPQGEKGDKGDTGTGVPEGGTPGQLLSKTDSGTAWVDPPSGNVLKGTLGPDPLLSADDAYATTPRRLTVYGETRQNLWPRLSGSSGGVSVSTGEDGALTLSGTASKTAIIELVVYTLQPGKTYTLSVDKVIPGVGEGCGFYVDTDVQGAAYVGNATKLSASYTINTSATKVTVGVCIAADTSVSGTYRVMLNEGSTAEPWCPPGLSSVDEVELVTAGKNLLPESSVGQKTGSSGAYASVYEGGLRFRSLKVGDKVTLSGLCVSENDMPKIQWRLYYGQKHLTDTPACAMAAGQHFKSTATVITELTNGDIKILIQNTGANGNVVVSDLQLEFGSTATAYEPPTDTTTPIDLDGNSLCSLPDGTCDELTIDATGAVTLTKRTGAVTFDGSSDERWTFTNGRLGLLNGAPGSPYVSDSENAYCDTLPVRSVVNDTAIMSYSEGLVDIRNSTQITSVETGKEWLASNPTTYVYPLATPQTIPLTSVTLPTLPAPTVNVFADAESSGTGYAMGPDMGMEYERDVNIAYAELEAKISALTVAQSTS